MAWQCALRCCVSELGSTSAGGAAARSRLPRIGVSGGVGVTALQIEVILMPVCVFQLSAHSAGWLAGWLCVGWLDAPLRRLLTGPCQSRPEPCLCSMFWLLTSALVRPASSHARRCYDIRLAAVCAWRGQQYLARRILSQPVYHCGFHMIATGPATVW
jgi:hypothetical protein